MPAFCCYLHPIALTVYSQRQTFQLTAPATFPSRTSSLICIWLLINPQSEGAHVFRWRVFYLPLPCMEALTDNIPPYPTTGWDKACNTSLSNQNYSQEFCRHYWKIEFTFMITLFREMAVILPLPQGVCLEPAGDTALCLGVKWSRRSIDISEK